MKRVIVDGNKVISILSGIVELITLNTPQGSVYIDIDEDIPVFVGDYVEDGIFHAALDKPSQHHTFDYDIKAWVDLRTLDEIKAHKWAEIKQQRDQLEFGGFEFEGNTYDSDQVSQGRIMGAASASVDQTWTLADNTTVELSAAKLQQVYAALQAHIANAHERGRIARQLIFDAETKEEVKEIQL